MYALNEQVEIMGEQERDQQALAWFQRVLTSEDADYPVVTRWLGKFYSAGNDREIARSILSSLRPDCVVFSENINNPIVHFLGYERWSPIQVLLMGAPVTGGIPSIDYFLSGDRLEHVSRMTQLLFLPSI